MSIYDVKKANLAQEHSRDTISAIGPTSVSRSSWKPKHMGVEDGPKIPLEVDKNVIISSLLKTKIDALTY